MLLPGTSALIELTKDGKTLCGYLPQSRPVLVNRLSSLTILLLNRNIQLPRRSKSLVNWSGHYTCSAMGKISICGGLSSHILPGVNTGTNSLVKYKPSET